MADMEVSWLLDGTTMYGTVIVPAGTGPFPGVVMVAGSGPTDRNWNSPLIPGDNGSAQLLAETLAENGVASLRYDKRASGPHARENLQALVGKISLQSHLEELAGAVRTLSEVQGIDTARIHALTNSEGALHALNYQLHTPAIPFAGLILTAPPGRAVGDVARSQVVAQLSPLPDGERLIAAYDASLGRFAAGQPADPDPELPEAVQLLLRSLETPVNLPFARELWVTNPAEWVAEVRVPVLIIIGKKDIQVDTLADGVALERAAAGHDNVTFIYPENANHVLKHETRPRTELSLADVIPKYNANDEQLDPEALQAILGWMAEYFQ